MSPFDKFYFYAVRIALAMFAGALLTASALLVGWLEMRDQRERQVLELNCINAACEKPCGEVKRFKRHEGCNP